MTRLLLVRLHRYVGLAMAGFLALAGLTGSIVAFQPELDAWLNPQLFRVEPAPSALPLDRLASVVEAADGQVAVSFVQPAAEPGRSTLVTVEPRIDPATGHAFPARYNQVFVDPSRGAILGTRLYGAWRLDAAHLMPFIMLLHYSLHMPQRWGDVLLGIVAIAWLIDCFVGFYLTLPARAARAPRAAGATDAAAWWARWKPAWRIKWGASAWRMNFDIHRAFGLWLWGLLFVVAMSSIAMNLNREVFTPAVRLFGTVTPSPLDTAPRTAAAGLPRAIGWDAAVDIARQHASAAARHWPVQGIYFSADHHAYEVTLLEPGDHDTPLRLARERIVLHAQTGERLAGSSYAGGTGGDKFLAWQYPLHSGQIGGLAGRIVVCVLGLAVFALSVTGVVIWLLKRRARRRRVPVIDRAQALA